MEIAIKPAYTPLTQQRLCCVPCAVQWILLRRKLPIFTQEELGIALNLTVPKKFRDLFGAGIKSEKRKPRLGWGTQGSDNEAGYNNFFREHKVPLKATYVPHSKLKNPAGFIATNLKKGNDIMVITHMSALDQKKKWGHALVVTAIELGKKPVLIVGDPDWRAPKFYRVELSTILRGMTEKVGKAERGLYVFTKK